jgi:two-component system, LytTR family, response regulator
MRVLLVDDEAPARALVREYLGALEPGSFELVGEATNGFEALEAIERWQPDLLLLDIQMPGLDGFEVLELLAAKPEIVFVTAWDDYALKAFEVGAVDYLLKPFSLERFAAALGRAAARRASGQPSRIEAVAEAASRGRAPVGRLLFRHEGRVRVLPTAAIDYVEAQGDYARFRAGSETLSKQQSLGELEALLDPARFVRIHRSYLLNLDRLARVELYAKDSRVAVLQDGTRLPVSRSGWARLRELS